MISIIGQIMPVRSQEANPSSDKLGVNVTTSGADSATTLMVSDKN